MKKLPSLAIVWVELLVACFSLSGVETNAPGEAQFLSQIRQLTFEGGRSGEGYFSLDGKALVFQSEREPGNPFYQIYILGLETGDSHRVSAGIGKTTCAFFRPNSDEVLFASTHLDSDAKAKQKTRSEEHTSELQSQSNLVCRLLLEKKKKKYNILTHKRRDTRYASTHDDGS